MSFGTVLMYHSSDTYKSRHNGLSHIVYNWSYIFHLSRILVNVINLAQVLVKYGLCSNQPRIENPPVIDAFKKTSRMVWP